MPLVDKTTSRPERSLVDAGGSELDDPLHQGGSQIRLGGRRGVLCSTFSEPADERVPDDGHDGQEHHQRADVRQAPTAHDDIGNGVGDQPRLGQQTVRGARPPRTTVKTR